MNTFSIKEALKKGWEVTKQNVGLWLGIMLTLAAVHLVLNSTGGRGDNGSFLLSLVGFVVQLVLELGIVSITLKLLDGQAAKYTDLFAMYPLTLQGVIAGVIVCVAVTVGLVLLIVPGIYIALRLSQTMYLLVDEKLSGVAALQKSWKITRGYTWQLLLLFVVLIGLNLLGVLLLLVGLLVTIPITTVAMAYVYRTINRQAVRMPIASTEPTPSPLPVGTN